MGSCTAQCKVLLFLVKSKNCRERELSIAKVPNQKVAKWPIFFRWSSSKFLYL